MALAALGYILISLLIIDQKCTKMYFFVGFIYPNKISEFMEGSLSDELIKNYRDDLDFQNLIDLLQKVILKK